MSPSFSSEAPTRHTGAERRPPARPSAVACRPSPFTGRPRAPAPPRAVSSSSGHRAAAASSSSPSAADLAARSPSSESIYAGEVHVAGIDLPPSGRPLPLKYPPILQKVLEVWRMPGREDGRSAYLVAILLSASCLFVVAGLHQGLHEAAGSRNLLKSDEHTHQVHCSRERSRAAWKAIDEYLMPFVEKEKYELPSKCRLRPDNDMFREQEQHKIHYDINEWRCGFCKKAFRAEKFLDQHFENRHNNLVDNSHGRCLADLCGALHCDLMLEFKKPKSKCSAAAAARNRHLCESLADSCFPINQGHSASHLHEFFLRQFCDAHTCSGGSKPFPKGGRKETNRFYLALCALMAVLLPLFYLIVFLHQREMNKGGQNLKRISKIGHKKKPS